MRQFFYLLIILNLLLFLWIYQSEQQPDQLQSGHAAIGDLHIVSDDVIRQLKSSDVINDAEAKLEPVMQVERKPLAPPHYLTHGVEESHTLAANPDTILTSLKHASSRKIVTSINGYEVVLYSLSSYHAAVRIFDQLQPFTDVEAAVSEICGEEQCRYFDASHFDDAGARSRSFDAAQFIYEDSVMM